MEITDGEGYIRTMMIQLICPHIQVFSPGDPIAVRLDLYSREEPGVLEDRREAAVSTKLVHITFARHAVSEENEHLRVVQRHRLLDSDREPVQYLLGQVSLLHRLDITVVLGAAASARVSRANSS